MGQRISNAKIAQIIKLHKDGHSGNQIAKKVGVNPHTVRSKIKDYEDKLKKKIDETVDEETDEIVAQLKGSKPKNIVKKIMGIMDDEDTLRQEYAENGLGPLNRILGTIVDKALKLHEIDQRKHIQEERDIERDNFFNALTDAIDKYNSDEFEDVIDEDSKKDDGHVS